ncbi:ABC transporter permease, partial [Listeria monocytogenes]|nr:ABC transporter permease [Listeria monocytogenes]
TYLALFPGLLILMTILSFNVLGDVLRKGLSRRY